MLLVAAAFAIVIGLTLGLLGGGGSILTLPMLVYVVHIDAKAAVAASLVVVGLTSLVGAALHARAGNVRGRVGAVFGAAGMLGALAGSRIGHQLPGTLLLVLFAVVMFATSLAMMRGRKAGNERGAVSFGKAVAIGGLVGVLSGLVGAGGGFLIVPALVLFGGLAMTEAVGTSLMVIAMQSAAGFAGHVLGGVELPWTLVLVVSAAAVLGSLLGAQLAPRVSPTTLRKGFAWLVLAMAIFMLAKELSLLAGLVAFVAAGGAVLAMNKVAVRAPAS